jgi:hypothetical protein
VADRKEVIHVFCNVVADHGITSWIPAETLAFRTVKPALTKVDRSTGAYEFDATEQ